MRRVQSSSFEKAQTEMNIMGDSKGPSSLALRRNNSQPMVFLNSALDFYPSTPPLGGGGNGVESSPLLEFGSGCHNDDPDEDPLCPRSPCSYPGRPLFYSSRASSTSPPASYASARGSLSHSFTSESDNCSPLSEEASVFPSEDFPRDFLWDHQSFGGLKDECPTSSWTLPTAFDWYQRSPRHHGRGQRI